MFDHPFQTPLGKEHPAFWNCPCIVSRPRPMVGGRSSVPRGKWCSIGKDVMLKLTQEKNAIIIQLLTRLPIVNTILNQTFQTTKLALSYQ